MKEQEAGRLLYKYRYKLLETEEDITRLKNDPSTDETIIHSLKYCWAESQFTNMLFRLTNDNFHYNKSEVLKKTVQKTREGDMKDLTHWLEYQSDTVGLAVKGMENASHNEADIQYYSTLSDKLILFAIDMPERVQEEYMSRIFKEAVPELS